MKKLIPIFMSLMLTSCGSDNSDTPTPETTAVEQSSAAIYTCTNWSTEASQDFHHCLSDAEDLGIVDLAYLKNDLYSHIDKFKVIKTKDSFKRVVLYKNIYADPNFQGSFFDSQPFGVSKVVIHEDGKEDIALLDNDTSEVFDFAIFDQHIYILYHIDAKEVDSMLKVAIFNLQGELQSEHILNDPGLFKDNCHDRSFPYNPCFEEDDKGRELYAFPSGVRNFGFSQSAEASLGIQQETGDLIIYLNSMIRSSGNLYRYRLGHNGLKQKMRSQLFPNIKMNEGYPISLVSGSEIFGFNRHARFHQKFILPLKYETLVMAYVWTEDIIKNLNLDQTLTREYAEENNISEDRIPYMRQLAVVAVDHKSGEIRRAKTISLISDFSDTFTQPFLHEGRVYLTHTKRKGSNDSTSRFHPELISFDAKTFEKREAIVLPFIDLEKASIVMDATLAQGEIVMSGRMNFTQNPHGESISQEGHAFMARYNFTDKTFRVKAFQYSERKEVVTSLFYEKEERKLFYGLTFDGPDTHSGDTLIAGIKQYATVLELEDF